MKDNKATLSAYMVEVVGDELRDLLHENGSNSDDLEIHETPSGMIEIQNVTANKISNVQEAEEIYESGRQRRRNTAGKSHVLFAIQVHAYNQKTRIKTTGKISFFDLAGSETVTSGKRGQESEMASRGLEQLDKVIEELSEMTPGKSISYRGSTLTRLMKDVIGGSAKTLMLVNCSPSMSCVNETLKSLEAGVAVKGVKNNV